MSDTLYHANMNTWFKSAIVVLALGFVGFIGAWQADSMSALRGTFGPTILQTISPVSSIVALVITVGVAALVGGVIARITTIPTGMFVLGFALFSMALKLHGAEEFIMAEGNYNLLALEALFLSVVILLGTLVVFAIGGERTTPKSVFDSSTDIGDIGRSILISFVMLPVIWFIAISPEKGQVIGAAGLGGILIGVLAKQFLQSSQPLLLFALPIAFGGIGYIVGITIGESSPIAFAQSEISPLLYPMPVEYAAGLLLGLSIGLGWSASDEKESEQKEAPRFA